LFAEIYVGPLIWKVLIKFKAASPGDENKYYVSSWVNKIKNHNTGKACVFAAAVNWKSSMQMKLMGL